MKNMPETIGKWYKSRLHKGLYELSGSSICAAINIQSKTISFGGFRPIGFNIGQCSYTDKDDFIEKMKYAQNPKKIQEICRRKN